MGSGGMEVGDVALPKGYVGASSLHAGHAGGAEEEGGREGGEPGGRASGGNVLISPWGRGQDLRAGAEVGTGLSLSCV